MRSSTAAAATVTDLRDIGGGGGEQGWRAMAEGKYSKSGGTARRHCYHCRSRQEESAVAAANNNLLAN